jgi:transcriptional regulator with XRE-family HTH domain
METNKTISERLVEIRQLKELTQAEFAKRLKMGRSTVANWENGTTPFTYRNVRLVSLEFKVREDWLINGTGSVFFDENLSNDQRELLEMYDKLISSTQKEVRDIVREKLELQDLREGLTDNSKQDMENQETRAG